jgi:hypothetical protein
MNTLAMAIVYHGEDYGKTESDQDVLQRLTNAHAKTLEKRAGRPYRSEKGR